MVVPRLGPVKRRVLDVAVYGPADADGISRSMVERGAQLLGETRETPSIRVRRFDEPDHEIAASHHLALSTDRADTRWSDVTVTSTDEAERLTEDRLVPWVSRWQEGRRAPRAQVAALSESDPSWPPTARRLIARLRAHLASAEVLRIDHIGSTSVEGMPAKNLIDIQVMVRRDDVAVSVAEAATAAGFVHVAGHWHGKDRNGSLHPEQVCVDADPGRPVNINIRSADRPVARDALLFRDWLRATPDARRRYLALKSDLAGRPVDDYGDRKEPFISDALHEADAWATTTGWTL